eukprot:scaffold158492_cov20-Tisochrysis_lutea.AAC.1
MLLPPLLFLPFSSHTRQPPAHPPSTQTLSLFCQGPSSIQAPFPSGRNGLTPGYKPGLVMQWC